MSHALASSAQQRHFLIVEPDPLFRLLLCVVLAGDFSDFHAVATYHEARALLAEHEFAAVVAEYHLPGGSGLALYEHVRRESPAVPFILMCGGMQVTLSDPHYRFLGKPFALTELVRAMAEMCAPKRP
jgi:DNA-binding NtrC family response regulator